MAGSKRTDAGLSNGGISVPFALDLELIEATGRVFLGEWTERWMEELSAAVAALAAATGTVPVQRGRVVALRHTDTNDLFSAFKSALYHSHYDDMDNTGRFPDRILASHHSNEPLRGESVLFLYVGVGKTVYDGLAMFGSGRLTRIIGGSRHSVPWGVEVPPGVEDRAGFAERSMPTIRRVAQLAAHADEARAKGPELEALRHELPVCYLMAPFVLEFSEEALVTKVFRQRLWEPGVAARDTGAIVRDMWECCCALDRPKFEALEDYFGPHTVQWEDGMRSLRESGLCLDEFVRMMREEDQAARAGAPGPTAAYDAVLRCLDDLAERRRDEMGLL